MSPIPFARRADDLARRLIADGAVARIWDRDPSLWTADDTVKPSIANRLGWLSAPQDMRAHAAAVGAFADGARAHGLQTVFLLGMGGSSLCAEVLASVPLARRHPLRVVVLDTTDESTVRRAAGRLDAARSLFLVASKSGGTVEVDALERFFWNHMSGAVGAERAGSHFAAITDPGTALARLARERGYRQTFLNPPDIGGRFSALSLFGLVPAALSGLDPGDLLAAAATHAEGCRQARTTNPGLELGAFMAAAALDGRDKLTLLLPPSLAAFGLWVEQLVAESTGKGGQGLIPVVDEPPGAPSAYGSDRAFVALATDKDGPDEEAVKALERAGQPLLRLRERIGALGAEFFRWEFATAVAGAVLGINPFDEPNVAEAKTRTSELLAVHAETGRVPDEQPAAADAAAAVFAGPGFAAPTPAGVLAAALRSLRPADYVAFLSWLPPDPLVDAVLRDARLAIRGRNGHATTVGFGPRYLHSTGQYHKGGPDRGLFVLLTANETTETRVPGRPYSFAVLKRAQALGDFAALAGRGRRAVRIHLTRADEGPERVLRELFREALA